MDPHKQVLGVCSRLFFLCLGQLVIATDEWTDVEQAFTLSPLAGSVS